MTKLENSGKSDVKSVKSEKERSNKRSHKKDKQKPQTKVIIRHLPPTMTEEDFLKQTDPLPPHDFYYFAAADWSLGYDATCRAYITMKNYDDVFLFRDRFDGYVFVDTKGAEYPAIVEFAPFQGLVKNKSRRVDNKVNTIEQEPHYQQFLAKLEEDREAAKGGECKLEFSLDRKKEEKITSTPLLQYLANKKEKRREEAKRRQEEKRRQREEDKEKRKQAQSQQQVTKIISNNEGSNAAGKVGNKSGIGKENVGEKNIPQQQPEEGRSSRSQRRAERNQRRREEFVRRRQEGEQREKKLDGKITSENEVEPGAGSEKKAKEQPQQANKSDDGKHPQKKEGGKRYSERRERDRNRNRKDKEKEKTKEAKVDDNPVKAEGTASEAIKAAAAAAAGGEAIVSESVMNFIRSVATAKEFVPKHKQQEKESLQNKSSDEAAAQTNDEKDNDTKTAVQELKKSDSNCEDDLITQKQRTAEEQRRIRNKDRPSIAIYQPKARLRMSEERDPSTQVQASAKSDTRSNPTSDCESVKKEETRSKKVSRYSERRAERRINKEKQKQPVDPSVSEQQDTVEQLKPDASENASQANTSKTGEKEPCKPTEQYTF